MDEEDLGLEEAIGAALDEQEGAPPEVAAAPAKPAEKAFPTADELPVKPTKEAASKEYVREGRRFVLKDGKETEVKDEAAPKPWRPTWYKDEYGPWDKLAEPFRNALREQERNAAQAIEKHSTSAKSWEPLTKALEPHMAVLQQANITPQAYYGQLHDWNVKFRTATDRVSQIDQLDALAQSVGLDLVQVGEWLSANGQAPQPDPRDQRIQQLEQRLNNFESQGQQAQRAAVENEIQAWSKDKPYFAEVRSRMAALAKADPEASLDELYEAALMAHPQHRERILADKRKSEVQRARDNSLNTRGVPTPNGSARSSPKLSLEEEIGMLLDGGTV